MVPALSTAWRYRRVALRAAKVLKFAADRINESTPQEREEISSHLRAIFQILRSAAKRKGEEVDPQLLSVWSLPPGSGEAEAQPVPTRRKKVRESVGQFVQVLKKYRLDLTRAEVAEIGDHLKSIWRLVSDIDRRAKVNAS